MLGAQYVFFPSTSSNIQRIYIISCIHSIPEYDLQYFLRIRHLTENHH